MKKMGKKMFRKRLTITKTGKIIRRHSNLGHNKAKKSGKTQRQNKKLIILGRKHSKRLIKHLH